MTLTERPIKIIKIKLFRGTSPKEETEGRVRATTCQLWIFTIKLLPGV
jgi:hypothetical protein